MLRCRLGAAHRDLPPVDASRAGALDWPFQAHIVLGMTIFLLFPFSRLVHVWSGFATVGYLFRPYQVVRSRRLNVPPGSARASHRRARRPHRRTCRAVPTPPRPRRTHRRMPPDPARAQVNGVPLHRPARALDADTLRQRACTELLRQAAQRAGLLAAADPAPWTA
jgi:hypothetical protein